MATLQENVTLADTVKRLGTAASSMLLHTPSHSFSTPSIDGIIGYQVANNCAVVIGDPLCLEEDEEALLKAFHSFCNGKKIIYLLTRRSFAHLAVKNGCQTLLHVGEEFSLDPTKFEMKQKLRWKVNQSLQKGVVVKEQNSPDYGLIKSKIAEWSNSKKGPRIHMADFSSYLDTNNRTFYAFQGDEFVGLLLLSPVDRYNGWVLTTHFSTQNAPVGTSENLITSAIQTLANEKCPLLYLGAVSGKQLGETIGLSAPKEFILQWLYSLSRRLFKLDSKRQYLEKYQPDSSPRYVVTSGKLTLNEIIAVMKVLNVKL